MKGANVHLVLPIEAVASLRKSNQRFLPRFFVFLIPKGVMRRAFDEIFDNAFDTLSKILSTGLHSLLSLFSASIRVNLHGTWCKLMKSCQGTVWDLPANQLQIGGELGLDPRKTQMKSRPPTEAEFCGLLGRKPKNQVP